MQNFENRLRFDKVTESLKGVSFLETQCRSQMRLYFGTELNIWLTAIAPSASPGPSIRETIGVSGLLNLWLRCVCAKQEKFAVT